MYGLFQMFVKTKWFQFSYLQNKDVLKICSFINYKFGTVKLIMPLKIHKHFPILETIDCPENATSLFDCQIKQKKYNWIIFLKIKNQNFFL